MEASCGSSIAVISGMPADVAMASLKLIEFRGSLALTICELSPMTGARKAAAFSSTERPTKTGHNCRRVRAGLF